MPQMRGAISSPRHKLAAAVPHRILGSTPPNFLIVPSKLNMWGNSTYGDCVSAEEAFAKACSGIFISEQEVERWAQSHGVLNGADLSSVLEWMQSEGFKQDGNVYSDGAHTAVDWTNPDVLKNAIAQSPVKIAISANQLQVGNGNGWFGLNYRRDQNSDHCVSLPGYGEIGWLADQFKVTVPSGVDKTKPGYALYTWSTIGILDEPSMLAITTEAWLRSPLTAQTGTNPPTTDPVTIFPPPLPPVIDWTP